MGNSEIKNEVTLSDLPDHDINLTICPLPRKGRFSFFAENKDKTKACEAIDFEYFSGMEQISRLIKDNLIHKELTAKINS